MRAIATLLCAIVCFSAQSTAQKQAAPGGSAATRTIRQTIWVAPTGYIRIHHLKGNLSVQGWDRDSLAIEGVVNIPPAGEFAVTPGKQGAKVSLWGPDETTTTPSRLLIRVPRRSQLWIKTESAHASVHEFEGQLDVATVSGDVEVLGRPAEVYVETMGGNINLSVQSRAARVKSGTGQVTLRGSVDDLTVSTVSGAVFALDVPTRQARFESVAGAISYTGDLVTPATLEFINHAGDIELNLSQRSQAEFQINTIAGRFHDEWGVTEKWAGNKGEGKEAVFSLSQEPLTEITIRNFRGTVRLRKR